VTVHYKKVSPKNNAKTFYNCFIIINRLFTGKKAINISEENIEKKKSEIKKY